MPCEAQDHPLRKLVWLFSLGGAYSLQGAVGHLEWKNFSGRVRATCTRESGVLAVSNRNNLPGSAEQAHVGEKRESSERHDT